MPLSSIKMQVFGFVVVFTIIYPIVSTLEKSILLIQEYREKESSLHLKVVGMKSVLPKNQIVFQWY